MEWDVMDLSAHFDRFLHESAQSFDPGPFVHRLFTNLGWEGEATTIEQVRRNPFGGTLLRASIASQPAVLLYAGNTGRRDELIPQLASFAYHSSIEWGLAATQHEIVLFNSHWTAGQAWFTLPAISTTTLVAHSDLLASLSPEALCTGDIERAAFDFRRPDHVLIPVDEKLVETLDRWRDEAMRHSRDTSKVDETLQSLFSQLFVLRSIEDRGLAPNIPSLRTCLTRYGDIDVSALVAIFDSAQSSIQSELFDPIILKLIPPFIIAGVIQDLYAPPHFPVSNVKYNFAWIDADILGRAYEKYLASLLEPRTLPAGQLRLFEQPHRDVARIPLRKASGVYYTPDFLVRFLVTKSVDAFFSQADANCIPRIADIACGSGSFLVAAADRVIKHLYERDPQTSWGRTLVEDRKLVGIDVDPRAVTLARLSVWLRLAEEPEPLPLPNLSKCIIPGDSLDEETWKDLPGPIDIIVGNPPFVATGRIRNPDTLASQFESARGRFDYAFLFIEQAVRKLKEEGWIALVVPNRVFSNAHATSLRKIVTNDTALETVVDFGSNEVFEGINAYIGLIVARKTKADEHLVRAIRVVDVPSRFPLYSLIIADRASTDLVIDGIKGFDARYHNDGSPWLLLSRSDRSTRARIQTGTESLLSFATVFQGIKTGANDIFVLDLVARGPIISECLNQMGDNIPLETALLKPVIYGSEIRRYQNVRANRVLIYPYEQGRPN